ncbi:MAG TPA: aminotransferase class III-fold pyridoxal phosphate-dependent enzyme [Woeseiaceae bacterium]|nr:aminotransferase class III-fold pyridoxal phosphate-dependent enzyme [Woeseiaceae bacterium]
MNDTNEPGKVNELLERRQRLLGSGSPLFYDNPLHLVRGEGVWLYDADGRRYLDAYNNVPHVGHCHPRVVDALCQQARTLNTHTRYLHRNILDYGERLTATFDDSLSMLMLACTGSEANEIAIRMARRCSGNMGIIATNFAYHGNTTTVATISSVFTPAKERGPYVRTIPAPDSYRVPAGFPAGDLAAAYAKTVQAAIDSLEADGVGVAAMLVDTIYSSEGLPDVPAGYVADAVRRVRAAGGFFIADEVQPGFGRMGDHMWGYQHHGVVPDIVTLGKPMGNGHPISGVVARRELVTEFGESTMYFNTFGGNPVSCAAAAAVLDVLEDEQLVENARVVGDYVLAGLRSLQKRHDIIGDVRGRGLFFATELVTDRATQAPATAVAKRIVNAMRDKGVLISKIGVHDNVLKMRPPMPFSREHAELLLGTLDECLTEL